MTLKQEAILGLILTAKAILLMYLVEWHQPSTRLSLMAIGVLVLILGLFFLYCAAVDYFYDYLPEEEEEK